MTIKEIKTDIRKLKKLKKACRAGTKERLELHRQIKELQDKLQELNIVDKDKVALIKEIYKKDSLIAKLNMDLTKHSVVDLQKYLNKLKKEKK